MTELREPAEQPDLISSYLKADQAGDPARELIWEELQGTYGEGVYSELLYFLTRQKFDPREAREHWYNIQAHRNTLRSELGRDLGVRAALCDYFVNIHPKLHDPVLVEDGLLRLKEQCAVRDDLTGLFNRRFFRGILDKQTAEASRYRQPFGFLMIDVDRFKLYNDRLGHVAGDRALADLAQVLLSTARTVDYVVRYGGEEFAVILPQTNKEQALAAAERHRRAVEVHHFPGQEILPSHNLTVSLGVACFPTDAHTSLDLVERADQALYRAKLEGRNRVVVSDPERRRYVRLEFHAPVDFRYQNGDWHQGRGETLDISLGGLGLAADTPVEQGRPVEIMIHLPERNQDLNLRGEAVRTNPLSTSPHPYQMGIALPANGTSQDFRRLVEERMQALP